MAADDFAAFARDWKHADNSELSFGHASWRLFLGVTN